MITPHFRILFFLTLPLLFIGEADAQTGEPTAATRTFRILSVVGSYDDLQYQTTTAKTSVRPLTLSRALSAPQPAPSGSKLEIFRMISPPAGAPAGTPPTRDVVLTATLDPNVAESIVVALPLAAKDKHTSFKGHTIPLGADYRAGTCLIANLSGFSVLAVSLKENVRTLSAGAVEIAKFERGHNPIKVAVQKGSDWAIAGNDAWRLNESYRGYILTLPYMEDPDYPPPLNAPPALVRINFEISPEMVQTTASSR